MNKAKLKNIAKGDRIGYFKDYYLIKTLIVVFFVSIISFILYGFFCERDVNILYVSVIDETLNIEKTEKLESDLLSKFLIESGEDSDNANKTVTIDDTYYTKGGAVSKVQIKIANTGIDVIIAPKESFDLLAGYGYFELLNNNFINEIDQSIVYKVAGYKEDNEVSFEDNETGEGEVLPYGIILADNSLYYNIGGAQDNVIVGVVANSNNKKNAYEFVEILMSNY